MMFPFGINLGSVGASSGSTTVVKEVSFEINLAKPVIEIELLKPSKRISFSVDFCCEK
ncbi:hypothetical protein [Leptothoe spongobia]|uniref:Uncharacterized protein n=1 Tax=Leptothoe spongobia TAU-MAC 1115 TaxID=1967444 RepID=A0A947DFU1_9CYAN|nr:hypothetical protein [Leptothoe spongobia]MBT9316277.1 hypothetical protein [Leptothoe spongobia TAU-MAC 1115]